MFRAVKMSVAACASLTSPLAIAIVQEAQKYIRMNGASTMNTSGQSGGRLKLVNVNYTRDCLRLRHIEYDCRSGESDDPRPMIARAFSPF